MNTPSRPNRYANAGGTASAKTLASTLLDKWYTKTDDNDTEQLLRDIEEEESCVDYDSVEDYEDLLNDLGTFNTSRKAEDE